VTAAGDARLDGPIGMTWTKQALLADLADQGIAYEIIEHPPVMTVEAARSHWAALPGFGAKNLLLKDAGGRLWLVVLPAEAPVDLKALPARIGSKRLSFARPPDLAATLAVEPGSVTPLAVVNDRDHRVTVVLAAELAGDALVGVHPMENTATVSLRGRDLVRFLQQHGHDPAILSPAS